MHIIMEVKYENGREERWETFYWNYAGRNMKGIIYKKGQEYGGAKEIKGKIESGFKRGHTEWNEYKITKEEMKKAYEEEKEGIDKIIRMEYAVPLAREFKITRIK